MNKKHKPLIFFTAFIPVIMSLFISTQTISSTIDNQEEVERATNLKSNQIQVVFDSHIFYNWKHSNQTNKNGSEIISKEDHKSIESNLIATLNEERKFEFGKEKEAVRFTINQINKTQFIIDFDITYVIGGNKINLKPSMLVLNNKSASLISNQDNYRLELNITVMK